MPSSVSTLRVRYAETDKMGVVYYANYLVWFEVGRADLLRSLGWSYREMELAGVSLPVIEAHCEYLRPARYDDEIEVRTEGRMLSPVRMEFQYQVVKKADQAVAVTEHLDGLDKLARSQSQSLARPEGGPRFAQRNPGSVRSGMDQQELGGGAGIARSVNAFCHR